MSVPTLETKHPFYWLTVVSYPGTWWDLSPCWEVDFIFRAMCELHAWRSSGRRNQHVFSTCYVSGDDYVLFLNPPSNGWSWRAGSCTSMESTMFGSKTSSWLEPQPCHSWAVSLGQSYNGSLFPGFFLCELMTLKAPTEGG